MKREIWVLDEVSGFSGLAEQHSHITLRWFKMQHQNTFNRMKFFFQATGCEILMSYLKPMQIQHSTGSPNSKVQELSQQFKLLPTKVKNLKMFGGNPPIVQKYLFKRPKAVQTKRLLYGREKTNGRDESLNERLNSSRTLWTFVIVSVAR